MEALHTILQPMNITDIIHTEDTETLKILKATPGMSHLLEQSLQRGYDERLWLETITTNLRLSERQMPEIYNHLPPICKRLGIPVPELYLQLSPIVKASAYVYDNKPYIVLTLGLIRRIKDEELDAVLAHECGHIICEHIVFKTLAHTLFYYPDLVSGTSNTAEIDQIKQAMITWSLASEFSADRIACLVVPASTLGRALARISLIPKDIIDKLDIKEWARQGKAIDLHKSKLGTIKPTHENPYKYAYYTNMPLRVSEALNWEKTITYSRLKSQFAKPYLLHKVYF